MISFLNSVPSYDVNRNFKIKCVFFVTIIIIKNMALPCSYSGIYRQRFLVRLYTNKTEDLKCYFK